MSWLHDTRLATVLSAVLLTVVTPTTSQAQVEQNQRSILDDVRFEQRLGADLPVEAAFVDASGRTADLAEFAGGKPAVLVLAWFDCPNLCPMVLDQVAQAAAGLPFETGDFRVLVASIAPGEGPAEAQAVRARLQRRHDIDLGNWRFLTGDKGMIDQLAKRVGFHYVYDAERDRYAHPAGMVITTPDAQVSRYLFGLEPASRDLRLALVQAGDGELGGVTDRVLLRCYRFDPDKGQYNVAVLSLVRWVGSSFALAVGGVVFWLWRRERR